MQRAASDPPCQLPPQLPHLPPARETCVFQSPARRHVMQIIWQPTASPLVRTAGQPAAAVAAGAASAGPRDLEHARHAAGRGAVDCMCQRAAAPPPRPRPPTRVHVPPPRLLALASLTHSRAPFCAPGTHADMNNNSKLLWAALLLTPLLAAGQDGELAHRIAPAPLQTTGVLSLPLLLPRLPPVPLCDASALTLNSYCVHCGSSGEQPLVCVAEGGKACKATVKVRASLRLSVLVQASQVCGPGPCPARSTSVAVSI